MPQSEWEKPSILGVVEEPAWSRAVKRLLKKKIFMATLALLMAILVIIDLVFHRIISGFIVDPIMIVSLLAGVFFFVAFSTLRREISDLKLTDAAIRESEERFRSVAETANDAIITIDTHGNIVFWNHVAETIYGYSADEIIGKQMASIISERFREAHQKGIDQIVSTGRSRIIGKTIEIIGLKKDGSEFPVELSLSTWTTRGGIFFNAALRDITERKKAEEALQESENRYRTIFKQAPDAILLFDSETGEMAEFNDKASENLGYTREEFQRLKIADFEVNESPEEVRKHIEKVVQEGSDAFETRQRRKNGKIRDIYVSTRTVFVKRKPFIQAIWRDITEHKQAEEALQKSEERFRSLVQTAAGIIICLSPDYRILEFNPEAERFFGFDRQEVLGKDYFELFIPATVRDLVAADIKKALEGEPTRGSEYTLKVSDGRKRVMMWNLSRLLDSREEPVGVIAVGQDITCRKRAEEKIGRLNHLYAVLSKINEAIVHIRDPQELYQKACRIAVEDGLFLTAWIGLIDDETNTLKPVAHWGVVDKYFQEIIIPVSVAVREGRGPTGTAIREGRPDIRNDLNDEALCTLPWHKRARELGYRSTASFPLRVRDRIVGSLNLYADKPYFFNDDEIRLLETLADDISFALLYREEENKREKAEELFHESEVRLHSIIESAHDAIITVNSKGNIVSWNHGAETIYGYSAEEVIGKPSTILWPERLRGAHLDGLKRALSTGMIEKVRRKAIGLSKDGREIALEGSYSLWKAKSEVFITAIINKQQP